jgi:hypothetical protein
MWLILMRVSARTARWFRYVLPRKEDGIPPGTCVSRRLRCMFHSGAGETRRMRIKPIIYGPQWKPLFGR